MHRIASAILIVAAVLAMNAGTLRDVLAEEYRPVRAAVGADHIPPVQARSTRLLSLLVVLESLRQEQVRLDGPKV